MENNKECISEDDSCSSEEDIQACESGSDHDHENCSKHNHSRRFYEFNTLRKKLIYDRKLKEKALLNSKRVIMMEKDYV